MEILSIIFFFVCTWGFGFTMTSFIKQLDGFWEKNIMRVSLGLGCFVVLGVLLNLLRIPLDWRVFLVLSLIYPFSFIIRHRKGINLIGAKNGIPKIKFSKNTIYLLILLIIFIFSVSMYIGGSFKYSYFEDDDPWVHSVSVKYVSIEKTVYEPEEFNLKYVDPYPPGYNILMGVLHQTSSSLMWTLKFFNGLIIALGIVFFYFFSMVFMGNKKLALFSTFVLAMLPSFLTHFIWAHSLVIILFFPAMYCLEKIKQDRLWMCPSMIAIASIFLIQPSQAIKLGIMFGIYFVVRSLYERKFLKEIFYAQIGGLLISLLWWGSKAKGMIGSRTENVVNASFLSKISSLISAYFVPNSGTATRTYTFSDFFIAKPFGGINVQVGWGIAISLLLILALILIAIKYKHFLLPKNYWVGVSCIWFIFTFLGVNAVTFSLPVGLITFRFWLLLAIPVALLSSLGFWFLLGIFKKSSFMKIALIIVVIVAIFATAGYQKYHHNTLPTWPPGAEWTSSEELELYMWLKTLPVETKVFSYGGKGKFILGLDKFTCAWCSEEVQLKKEIYTLDAKETYQRLKQKDYEYLIFEVSVVRNLINQNKTQEEAIIIVNEKLQELIQSNLFTSVKNINGGGIILRLS
jgi:hypothetical protein